MAALYDATPYIHFSYLLTTDAFFTAVSSLLTDGITVKGLMFWNMMPKLFLTTSLMIVYPEKAYSLTAMVLATTLIGAVNSMSLI